MFRTGKFLAFGLLIAGLLLASGSACPAFAADEAGSGKSAKSDEAEGKPKPKQSSDVSGGRFAGDPIYVHIDPILLPVITDQGAEQLITLVLVIEVNDMEGAENIQTNMPRVRDSLMQALYGGLGQGALRDGKLVDVARVKAKANKAIGDIVGAAAIKDVLVQGVAQRML